MQVLNASLDKTYVAVEIYRMQDPKSYVDEISGWKGWKFTKIKTDEKDFSVRQAEWDRSYERIGKILENVNYEVRYITSKAHLYIVTVWNKGKDTSAAERLFASIKLGSENAAVGKAIKMSEMRPVTIEQMGRRLSKKEIEALPENPKIENGTPGALFILYAPWSGFNFAETNSRPKGVVRLRVTYSKEGRIDKIDFISGLPGGLNRLAFFSILRTKFLPAEKDGEPVTTEGTVNYDYTRQF
jgi:hypothetical protein